MTAFGAGKPGLQQRIGLLILFHQRQRTPVHQHQHQRFAGGFKSGNQIALALRQGDIGPAGGLMRHALRLAHHGDHHIGLLRRRDRFVDHFLRRAWVNLHRVLIQIEEIDNAFVIGNVRPFGVNHFAVIAQRFFDAGQDGHRLVGHPGRGPAAHHVALAVRQRAHHRDSAGFFQRQRIKTVLQQHQALASHFARLFTMQTTFRIGVLRVRIFRSQVAVGIVEQSHIIFHVEHVSGGIIQLGHGHLAGLHQPRQVLAVILVAHAHVDAGLQRYAHRVFRVGGHAVLNQLFDGAVVGNGDAFKAPLVAQDVFQQPGIRGRRGAVQRVQGHHHRAAAGIKPGFIRRHIVVEQALRAHVDRIVLFPALHRAVGGEMLDAGHHRIAVRRALALHRLHHRLAHHRGQIGVFPEPFGSASPARVAGDVDHRRPGHVQAVIGGFIS